MTDSLDSLKKQFRNYSEKYEHSKVLCRKTSEKLDQLHAALGHAKDARKEANSAAVKFGGYKVPATWRGKRFSEFDSARRDDFAGGAKRYRDAIDRLIGEIDAKISALEQEWKQYDNMRKSAESGMNVCGNKMKSC